ncbi:MAG: glycoside hydrolase family 9 protein [Paludibacteraceae bacterium]|nr:glycoside hydrolase family 9 protein [Paludibacteraceae bacterium]
MKQTITFFLLLFIGTIAAMAQNFQLNNSTYFETAGVNVMAFDDFYPEGHQGGVSILMNGHRIATNGDIRFEPTPGQWQPVPKKLGRKVTDNTIITTLCYPDSSRHKTGFNPMIYPDLKLNYQVRVEARGTEIIVSVDLDQPIPERYLGKVGFNLEFFPGYLFGKSWLMDEQSGIFPQQPNGPLHVTSSNLQHSWNYTPTDCSVVDYDHLLGAKLDENGISDTYSPIIADDYIAEPYAVGKVFTSCPEDPLSRLTIESTCGADLKLYDGRMNHNNGWFVLRSEIPAGKTRDAITWTIRPNIVADWMYQPVIQTSQIGYLPSQTKAAVIELDKRDLSTQTAQLYRIGRDGKELVREITPTQWGDFLRYRYLKADFSDIQQPGMYQIAYGNSESAIFRIGSDVYERGVWQPVIEYFLPVQMCHMRVTEKYRVWHDRCHMDDAQMAHHHNHFDGYDQKNGDWKYQPGELVDGLNVGGWHDAGDFDLRVESQAGECYILALAMEQFHPAIDATLIDQVNHLTEIHQPDGKNDILQQIEHGALTVTAGYRALGRLYRGIICNGLRQYVMLGDAAAMTDGIIGNEDDRWVYTEHNPQRELSTAAQLAGTSRVLRGFNDKLADECLTIAEALYDITPVENDRLAETKMHAAAELFLSTDNRIYLDYIISQREVLKDAASRNAWYLARVEQRVNGMKDKKIKAWVKDYKMALQTYADSLALTVAETPYGVPYRPAIWGAGWNIQAFGFKHYFLAKAYPEIFSAEPVCNALNFILGCHPGSNQASFASGVGAQSATVGYGLNRADWSYIPGGVVSGTALIRPDFPELLTFPFLWQQVEYVLGGGSSHYMFLVLAVNHLLNN